MKLLRKITLKFKNAYNGIRFSILNDKSVKIQLGFMAIALFLAWFYKITTVEWTIIIIVSTLVVGFEFLNSSIELLSDYVSNAKYSMMIKNVKDVASAGVLIVAICALVVGIIIFKKYIF